MPVEVRPLEPGRLEAWLATLEVAAGRRMSAAVLGDAAEMYAVDRALAAWDGDRIVGGVASDRLAITVPGPAIVPAARITLAAVLPMYRRQGVVSRLFERQVADLQARGEPLAIFTTTGPGLYRRAGYAPATVAAQVELETAHGTLEAEAPPGVLRFVEGAELARLLPGLFDRHRAQQPGQVLRTPAFWRMWLEDRPQFRRGEAADRFVVAYHAEPGDEAQGYLVYRLRPGPARDQPVATLFVEELVAATADAERALWRFCFAFRQAESIVAPNTPVDTPAGWLLADPRRLRVTRIRDFVWLRILDVEAALNARGYAAAGRPLVLAVHDPACAANDGRFRIELTAAGAGRCVRTEEAPDLELRIEDLSAVYLGGVSLSTLQRAGRVREHVAGAVERCDRAFASRPAPWTVTDW